MRGLSCAARPDGFGTGHSAPELPSSAGSPKPSKQRDNLGESRIILIVAAHPARSSGRGDG
jgi:hypothetical protein